MGAYCRCSLDKIEMKYTLEQFIDLSERLSRKEDSAQKEIVDVVVGCIDKLPSGATAPS
jgi:hypothetical protein